MARSKAGSVSHHKVRSTLAAALNDTFAIYVCAVLARTLIAPCPRPVAITDAYAVVALPIRTIGVEAVPLKRAVWQSDCRGDACGTRRGDRASTRLRPCLRLSSVERIRGP